MKRFIQISIVVIISSVLLAISYSLEDYSYEPNDNRWTNNLENCSFPK